MNDFEKTILDEANSAYSLIEKLRRELPADHLAILILMGMFRKLNEILAEYFNSISRDEGILVCKEAVDPKRERSRAEAERRKIVHDVYAFQAAASAVEMSKALLTYVTKHEGVLDIYLQDACEWPAVISVEKYRDVRRSMDSFNLEAESLYQPVYSAFGKKIDVFHSIERSPGIFHELAHKFEEAILGYVDEMKKFRSLGLPWIFDFVDKDSKLRMIPHPDEMVAVSKMSEFERIKEGDRYPLKDMTRDERLKWIAAMRYCIYLTLAPQKIR
jgi:hypothetical protein